MASKKARNPNRPEKKLTRSYFKKLLQQEHNNNNNNNNNNNTKPVLDQTSSSSIVSTCSSSTTTSFSPPSPSPAMLTSSDCCTPKTQKSRIPEILTCPPAPMKQRVSKNCVSRRRQIVFFAPPEIELFFVNAHNR